MGGRRRERRTVALLWLAGVGGVLLLAGLFAPLAFAGDGQLQRYANQAQLIGLLFSAAGALVAGLRWLHDRLSGNQGVADWAAELARRVRAAEERNRQALLGGAHAADLRFGEDARAADELTAWFVDPESSRRLRFDALDEHYRSLGPRGRLVILGQPGSGKTVSALQLIVRLAREHAGADRVPVRFNLASWPGARHADDWMADRLIRDYDVPASRARDLVRDQRLLPVLDGLDEMDPEDPDGLPRRALDAVRWLNEAHLHGGDLAPVILTCRVQRYEQLMRLGAAVQGSRDIRVLDLDPEQIGDYVSRAFQHDNRRLAQWRPILAALARPDAGPLWSVLATPWRLTLAATLVRAGRDPAELLSRRESEGAAEAAARIERQLLAEYVDATASLARGATGAPPAGYRADDVRRWLRELARRLQRRSGRSAHGYPTVDIVPHEVIGAGPVPRAIHAAVTGLVMAAGCAMLALNDRSPSNWVYSFTVRFITQPSLPDSVIWAVIPFAALLGAPVLAAWRGFGPSPAPVARARSGTTFDERVTRNFAYTWAAVAAPALALAASAVDRGTVRPAEPLLLVPLVAVVAWLWASTRRRVLPRLGVAVLIAGLPLGLASLSAGPGDVERSWPASPLVLVSVAAAAVIVAREAAVIADAVAGRLDLRGRRRVAALIATAALLVCAAWLSSVLGLYPQWPVFVTVDGNLYVDRFTDSLGAWAVPCALVSGVFAAIHRRLDEGVVVGLVTGFSIVLVFRFLGRTPLYPTDVLGLPIAALLGAYLAALAAAALLRDPAVAGVRARRPLRALRDDLVAAAGAMVVIGVPTLVVFGSAAAESLDFLDLGFVGALGIALASAVAFGLLGRRAWFRYALGCLWSAARGELPLRPGRFLDWAAAAGLLRVSGSVYQFRHLELQQWLLTSDAAGREAAGTLAPTG